jgi:hypothetical protein
VPGCMLKPLRGRNIWGLFSEFWASLYYELVEHKKGQPFLTAEVEETAEARSSNDMLMIAEVEAVLHSREHRGADPALKGIIQQALK